MHATSFFISLVFLVVYVALFVEHYRRRDGRARQYLLVTFAALGLFFLVHAAGYWGLQCGWISGVTVNFLFRYDAYLVAVPGIWVAVLEFKG